MKYYKISSSDANAIGYFEYAKNQALDPFAGEQVDGTFIISDICYDLLKDHSRLEKIDFSKKEKVNGEDLIPKNP